jgi:hypothetical protein
MIYDPIRDAPGFRDALKKLAEVEHLTSQAIIDLFNRNRVRGDNMSISRATLDRFIQGEDITRIRELRAIHDLLRAQPAWQAYFDQEPPAPKDQDIGAFARMFGAFLAPESRTCEDVCREDMRAALPGQFVMMRRDHDRISVEQGVRVSLLTLSISEGGIAVRETQSYRTLDYDVPFEQTDQGYMFTHGGRMYFLMKEDGGTAVKFGVIDLAMPEIERRGPVQYLQGHVLVVSRRGVFPRARFAARRFSPNQHPMTSGIVPLTELVDPRAIAHLRLDFTDGSMDRSD